jgi:class 3 adenylate cyclase
MNRADAKRKLAAILAADIVGYSKLVGSDEEGTVERLRRCAATSSIRLLPATTAGL